jgi:hypothetical protein
MLQSLSHQAEPRIINLQEERPLEEWQAMYPDLWLLLGEKGRLGAGPSILQTALNENGL